MRHTQPFPFVRADFIGPEGNSPVKLSNSLNQHRPANLRHSGGFDNDTKDMRMRNGLNGLVSSNSRICFAVITQKSIGVDPLLRKAPVLCGDWTPPESLAKWSADGFVRVLQSALIARTRPSALRSPIRNQ